MMSCTCMTSAVSFLVGWKSGGKSGSYWIHLVWDRGQWQVVNTNEPVGFIRGGEFVTI
jgi:hypothetical protein